MNRLDREIVWIILATAILLSPALLFSFQSDDFQMIETARHLSLGSLLFHETWVYYRPLVFLSYAVEYAFWQAAPAGYHATNVLLHLINTVLVYQIAKALLKEKRSTWIFSAVLFGITPIHASSVLWILGRTDLLCGTFYLLAVLAYLVSLNGDAPGMRVLSACSFVCALLSKEMAGSLPLVCLAWGVLLFKRTDTAKGAIKKALRASWIYFLLLAAYLGARVLLFGHFPHSPTHSNLSIRHILTDCARYSAGLLVPFNLEGIKPFFRTHPELLFAGSLLVLGIVLVLARWFTTKHFLILSVVWTAITLTPVLRLYAPWYLYIPSVGVALGLGYLTSLVAWEGRTTRTRIWLLGGLLGVHLFGLMQIESSTMVAGRMSRRIVSGLLHDVKKDHTVLLLNLPTEYRGVPVFGWTGNLSYGLRLLGHPLAVKVLSGVRYASAESRVEAVVDPQENTIALTLQNPYDFFRIENMGVVTGVRRAQPGDFYQTPDASVEVTALNAMGEPSALKAKMKSTFLREASVPVYVYSQGRLQALEYSTRIR